MYFRLLYLRQYSVIACVCSTLPLYSDDFNPMVRQQPIKDAVEFAGRKNLPHESSISNITDYIPDCIDCLSRAFFVCRPIVLCPSVKTMSLRSATRQTGE